MIKVAFPIIDTGTGDNVYFQLLARHLPRYGIEADVIPFSYRHEFLPVNEKRLQRQLDKYDVIHANVDYGIRFRLPDRKFITSFYHNIFEPSYTAYTTLLQRVYHHGLLKNRISRALAAADCTICISHATLESASRTYAAFSDKLRLVTCGIDTQQFSPDHAIPVNERELLFVGSLSRRKGADLLPQLMDRLPDFTLTCVTRNPRSPVRHERIRIAANLDMNELVDAYRRAELLILPTRLEGFGYVVAESMATGTPVVSTRAGSIPELIDNRENGYLVNIDDIDGMVEVIRGFTSAQPAEKTRLSVAARNKIVKNFDIERSASEIAAIYRE